MNSPTTDVRVRRLAAGDRNRARQLFGLLAAVFEEPGAPLTEAYLDCLLGRADFWALVAVADDMVVGGLTAHVLPMTRAEVSELFIYDVAVRPDWQRRGVGRQLVDALRSAAGAAGIGVTFVPADDADAHALAFYRAVGGAPSAVTLFVFADPDAQSGDGGRAM